MQRTRPKHGQRSYLSVGIVGDSQGLLERETLWSKDRGLLSYNMEQKEMLLDPSVCYVQLTCDLPFVSNRHVRCTRTQNMLKAKSLYYVVSNNNLLVYSIGI